jgi:hypothetical protein
MKHLNLAVLCIHETFDVFGSEETSTILNWL